MKTSTFVNGVAGFVVLFELLALFIALFLGFELLFN